MGLRVPDGTDQPLATGGAEAGIEIEAKLAEERARNGRARAIRLALPRTLCVVVFFTRFRRRHDTVATRRIDHREQLLYDSVDLPIDGHRIAHSIALPFPVQCSEATGEAASRALRAQRVRKPVPNRVGLAEHPLAHGLADDRCLPSGAALVRASRERRSHEQDEEAQDEAPHDAAENRPIEEPRAMDSESNGTRDRRHLCAGSQHVREAPEMSVRDNIAKALDSRRVPSMGLWVHGTLDRSPPGEVSCLQGASRMKTTRLWLMFVTCGLWAPAYAVEPVPVGPPFEVHAEGRIDDPITGFFFEGFCCSPRMAGDADGSVFITWTGDPGQEGLFARKFDEGGEPETDVLRLNGYVNDTDVYDYYASRGAIGADAAGNFIVAWVEDSDVEEQYGYNTRIRRLSPTGGFATEKIVDSYGADLNAGVAVDPSGGFVVAWSDAEEYAIFAQRGGGNSLKGTPVQVSINSQDGPRFGPEVAVDGQGRWMVVWERVYDYALSGRVLDENLTPLSEEFTIATGPPEEPRAASIVALDEGGFIVAWFDYDSYGAVGRHVDGQGNLGAEFPIATSDAKEVAAARVDAEHFVVVWYEYANDLSTDVMVQLHRNDGSPEGSPFLVDSEAEGGHHAYLAATGRSEGAFAVVWDGYDPPPGTQCTDGRCGLMTQWFAISEEPQRHLLPGRRLLVTNRVPDHPEKNRAKWLVKDSTIAGITPATLSDPRCLFDPEGTVKATMRFMSVTSGQDTGPIPLPCQYWEPFGPAPQQNWKYRDKTLSGGPCDQVILKAGKSVKVTCRGKPGVASFPYDLQPGVSEGPVDVALVIGTKSYCTTFAPVGPFDGQDGKRFLGKNAPPPTTCAAHP